MNVYKEFQVLRLLKRIAIAFSMYSRIPMPVFNWEDEDYRHAIAFLPLVGAVIGAISYCLICIDGIIELPIFVLTALLAVIPVLVTGGFHLDGFMDVSDALSSYQGKEKCLEIMKDPHIGAFAVISLLRYAILFAAPLYYLVYDYKNGADDKALCLYLSAFVIVRAFCGISSLCMKKAKKDGMLHNETKSAGRGGLFVLIAFLAVSLLFTIWIATSMGIISFLTISLYTWYYGWLCNKRFGGVTGDTAGYYICHGELIYVWSLFVIRLFTRCFIL